MYSSQTQLSHRDLLFTRLRRALLGAFYGLLGATAFAGFASLADFLFYPALPLGYDWPLYLSIWSWLGPGLALVGFAACWWDETWQGLFSGMLVAAMLLLVSALLSSRATGSQKVAAFFIIFMPTMVICFPAAFVTRWLVQKHAELWARPQAAVRIAGLILLFVAASGSLGLFMRMPPKAAQAITYIENLLVNPPGDKPIFDNLPGLQEHRGQPFKMFQKDSATSVAGFDIRAVYADGYEVACTVVLYQDQPPVLNKCQATP